jgi:hypothetical protein
MSQDLNDDFLIACEVGDIAKVKDIYNSNYPPFKNIFEKFINIFNFKKPLLDIENKHELPFMGACIYGHLDIVQFLCTQKPFLNKISNERLALGLASAIENNHIEIAAFILPFIKKFDHNFEDFMYSSFQSCCKKGNLDGVKYILDHLNLRKNKELLNYEQGFINACESGNINIIDYFVKEINFSYSISKKATKNPKNLIQIKDIDVLHYFVNELHMKKNDEFFHRLLLDEKMRAVLNNALEKRELYVDLNNDLNNQSNKSLNPNKKLKL